MKLLLTKEVLFKWLCKFLPVMAGYYSFELDNSLFSFIMLLIRFTIFLFILFLLSSCRNNSFAPTTPENVIIDYEETDPITKPEKGDIFHLDDKIEIEYKTFSTSDKVDVFV